MHISHSKTSNQLTLDLLATDKFHGMHEIHAWSKYFSLLF